MAIDSLQSAVRAFGERYARGAALGAACLAAWTLMTGVIEPSPFPLASMAGVLLLSHWFRRRALADAERRRGVLEDERDALFLARGDRAFRSVASAWAVGLAFALAVPASRAVLLDVHLRLPGALLLGVIIANFAGHASVAMAYARERR
ncbi:conserved membrane hypothetical protein [Luteimonas sp. 9C]|uniref:hypothetical protein n=1 Tax=Luteimonas sp. 9C TaxID=2653148 RepID=UPI0012EF7636|nr:hypothetical protein [Luteimonas sp. 9C]VXB51895.1 conserved membrane hypothetical protein [Luteimonas sp. 9C]